MNDSNKMHPDEVIARLGSTMSERDALRDVVLIAPVLSKYHGMQGFEVERFIVDYELWKKKCRAIIEQSHGVAQDGATWS
jgi:hypothetical protein